MADDDPVREGDEPVSKSEPDAGAPVGAPSEPGTAAAVTATATKRRAIPWWSFVLAALVVEFFVYGHAGHIEVCVGKSGETDFDLVDQERTDANRWKFPRCESRTNLGLVSHRDQLTKEAVHVACRGATIFRHQGEGKACTEGKAGWEQHIETSQCPPWHGHFYEHLFWFLK